MNQFPDVLGMRLEQAKCVFESEGIPYHVNLTEPRKEQEQDGLLRVVKCSESADSVILTACKIPDSFYDR